MTSRFDEYFNFLEHDDDPMNMSDSVVEEMEKIIESMPPKLSDFSNTDSTCSSPSAATLGGNGWITTA